MALDRIDWVAVVGILGLAGVSQLLMVEPLLVAAGLGGFGLSVSLWRLYAGHVWEALGWLAWVGAAVILALGPAGQPVLLLGFIGAVLIGIGLLFGGRTGWLPEIWIVDDDQS